MGELGEISKWLNNQLKAENRGNFLHFLFYTLEWEIYSARMCLLLLWLAVLLHCYSWIQHWIHWLLSNSSWINKSVTGTLNTGIGMADNFRWQDMLEPRFEWWSGFNLMYAFGSRAILKAAMCSGSVWHVGDKLEKCARAWCLEDGSLPRAQHHLSN